MVRDILHGHRIAHPLRMALPNGRRGELPPRNKSHTVWPNTSPCESDWKPTAPVAPPKLSVMTFPLAWQEVMSEASAAQLGRFVPGKVELSVGLQL